MAVIALILIASALLFAMFCFLLIARPHQVLGVLVYFAGRQKEWHEGKIDAEAEHKIYSATRRIEKVVLFCLFGWSIFCGALLALIEILQVM